MSSTSATYWKLPAWGLPTLLGATLAVCLHASFYDRLALSALLGGELLPPLWRVWPSAWFAHLRHLAGALWITIAFWGSGRVLLDRLKITADNAWECAALSTALGSLLWGGAFFLLGVCGALDTPLLWGLLGVGGAWGGFLMARVDRLPRTLPQDGLAKAALLLAGALLLLLLPNALVPETFYDSLEYHLGLPSLYLLEGRLIATPEMAFAGVPGLAGLLYGWALTLDHLGITAHVLAASFTLKTCCALMGIAVRLKKPAAGAWAVLLFAAIPIVQSLTYMTTVELVWAYYTVVLLGALLALSAAPQAQQKSWSIVVGLLLGAALLCKNLAWGLPLAVVMFPGVSWRNKIQSIALGGACLAVWWLKNTVQYGNPLFPFLHSYLRPEAVQPATAYLGEGAKIAWGTFPSFAFFGDFVLAPWRMMLFRLKMPDSLGPLFLGLLPLLGVMRLDRSARQIAIFTAAVWLPLSLAVMLPRYFVAAVAPLMLLYGWLITASEGKTQRRLGGLVLAAALIVGVAYRGHAVPKAQWQAFTGERSPAAYLTHSSEPFYHSPLFPAAQFLKSEAHVGRLLLFGDARPFYLRHPFIYTMPLQASHLERWAASATNAEELYTTMAARGISHIVVNHAEIVRLQTALKFSVKSKRVLDAFWAKYTLKVHQTGPDYLRLSNGKESLDRWLVVYRLLSPEQAALPHAVDELFSGYKVQ
jgi:hypothetical protein